MSELSRETGIAPEDIAFAETATGPADSIQRETGEDGFTLEARPRRLRRGGQAC